MADNQEKANKLLADALALQQRQAESARNLVEELKDQLGIRSRMTEGDKQALSLSRQLANSAAENNAELRRTDSLEKQIRKDNKLLLKLKAEQLQSSRDLTAEQQLEAEMLSENNEKRLAHLEAIDALQAKLKDATEAERSTLLESLQAERNSLAVAEEAYKTDLQSASLEVQRAALATEAVRNAQALIKGRQGEKKIQDKINKQLGIAGALMKGLTKTLGSLGLNSSEVSQAIEEAAQEMYDLTEAAVAAGEKVNRFKLLGEASAKVFKAVGKELFSLEFFSGAILKSFLGLDKASTKIVRLTGQNNAIAASFNTRLATGADILENMAEFTERTGLAASAVFSNGDLARMAEAKNMLGLTAQEANNLGTYAKASGTSIDSYQEGIVESVNSFNAANDSAVAHGVILKDVLNASSDIAMSLAGNPTKIAGAAAAARKLGVSLEKVNEIAGSLMNFESSIEAELEAQLLTGRQINMSKARELALNNDLEGLATEINKQIGSSAEFANMNRIEQEALAKSLGMSREELAKTLIAQAQQGDLTDKQRAKMRGVTVEQLKQMEAGESLQKALAKLAEPVASLLTVLTPIVNVLAKIIAFAAPVAGPIWAIVTAMKALGMETSLLAIRTAALNGVRKVQAALQNTVIGRYIAEKAQLLASTVAKYANVGATAAQSGANTALATSQTAVASTGAAAGGGLAAAGAGLGAFGAAAAPAIPIILAIGAALLMAAPAIWAIGTIITGLAEVVGNVLIKAIDSLPAIVTAIASGFTQMFGVVGENIGTFLLMGPALLGIAAGLSMLGPAGIMALPGIAALGALVAMATPLAMLGSLFSGGGGGDDNSGVEEKLDLILEAIQAGGNVYIDGNQVGQALVLGSYKSS